MVGGDGGEAGWDPWGSVPPSPTFPKGYHGSTLSAASHKTTTNERIRVLPNESAGLRRQRRSGWGQGRRPHGPQPNVTWTGSDGSTFLPGALHKLKELKELSTDAPCSLSWHSGSCLGAQLD